MIKWVFLSTDFLVYALLLALLVYVFYSMRHEHLRAPWRKVFRSKLGISALIILFCYGTTATLDSMHFRLLEHDAKGAIHYSARIYSVLDMLIRPIGEEHERSYSAPLAQTLFAKETVADKDGRLARVKQPLKYVQQFKTHAEYMSDLSHRVAKGALEGVVVALVLLSALFLVKVKFNFMHFNREIIAALKGRGQIPWRTAGLTLFVICIILGALLTLAKGYHVFGTGKVGEDIFYLAIKSIRTGLVIGTLTTLVMLPFAVFFGAVAGYFQGWVDDVIQYVYTTLSSIPGILLIAAAILSLQVFINNRPDIFTSVTARADARLLALCIILGITSWTSLCRLIRAETLKLREMDYVSAAKVLGVRQHKIITRHVLPNVMHIILITVVLDFSILVLAEAVLAYVGIGVDPTTHSWGNIINAARLELARDPVVWWPILAAFLFMFILVLAANLFADKVRDAFDPRVVG